MMLRAAVIWGAIGLVVAFVIDLITPEGVHLWLYSFFGVIAGGGSWGLRQVSRIPQGLVIGAIVGFVVGLVDGTMMAAADSVSILHPEHFIALKYVATAGLFALLALLPWSLRT